VSQQPERKEKDCLNCGTMVQGRFCHVCGQENIITKQNVLSLTRHFVYDIFHFDGKFFHTLKYLLLKPGLVPKQFVVGKRQSYIDPIRMYLFTSAVFFLIFFSFNNFDIIGNNQKGALTNQDRVEIANELQSKLNANPGDSVLLKKIHALQDTTIKLNYEEIQESSKPFVISFDDNNYLSIASYDSIQNSLPENDRDGWLKRKFQKRSLQINEKYEGNMQEAFVSFLEIFLHKVPYLFFVSLPFFALLLKLLYIRRKEFYYSDHFIFTLYHYIISFILFFFILSAGALRDITGWSVFNWIVAALVIWWMIYFYKGLKNFYQQSRGKTVLKFLILNVLGYFLMVLLFLIFLLFSVFQF
jgi:hypothetical protein